MRDLEFEALQLCINRNFGDGRWHNESWVINRVARDGYLINEITQRNIKKVLRAMLDNGRLESQPMYRKLSDGHTEFGYYVYRMKSIVE